MFFVRWGLAILSVVYLFSNNPDEVFVYIAIGTIFWARASVREVSASDPDFTKYVSDTPLQGAKRFIFCLVISLCFWQNFVFGFIVLVLVIFHYIVIGFKPMDYGRKHKT